MRLVGLPGERVELRDGDVTIDGRVIPKPEHLRYLNYLNFDDRFAPKWGQTGHSVTLDADEYFVLGDFSAHSRDSRFWQRGAQATSPSQCPRIMSSVLSPRFTGHASAGASSSARTKTNRTPRIGALRMILMCYACLRTPATHARVLFAAGGGALSRLVRRSSAAIVVALALIAAGCVEDDKTTSQADKPAPSTAAHGRRRALKWPSRAAAGRSGVPRAICGHVPLHARTARVDPRHRRRPGGAVPALRPAEFRPRPVRVRPPDRPGARAGDGRKNSRRGGRETDARRAGPQGADAAGGPRHRRLRRLRRRQTSARAAFGRALRDRSHQRRLAAVGGRGWLPDRRAVLARRPQRRLRPRWRAVRDRSGERQAAAIDTRRQRNAVARTGRVRRPGRNGPHARLLVVARQPRDRVPGNRQLGRRRSGTSPTPRGRGSRARPSAIRGPARTTRKCGWA